MYILDGCMQIVGRVFERLCDDGRQLIDDILRQNLTWFATDMFRYDHPECILQQDETPVTLR